MATNPFELIDRRLANIEGLLLDLKHNHRLKNIEVLLVELKQQDKRNNISPKKIAHPKNHINNED